VASRDTNVFPDFGIVLSLADCLYESRNLPSWCQLILWVSVIIWLGGGAGRIYKIGNQAVNNRIEFYYNVEKPDSAPDWTRAFTFQFLFPK
jgi:hypothetical protein